MDNWKKKSTWARSQGRQPTGAQVQIQDAFKAEADTVIQRLKDELDARRHRVRGHDRNDPPTLQAADTIQINIKGVPATKAGDFRGDRQRQLQRHLESDHGQPDRLPADHEDHRGAQAAPGHADPEHEHHREEDQRSGLGRIERAAARRQHHRVGNLVQLPGVDDPARIKQILKTAAMLELYEVRTDRFASREEAHAKQGGVLPLNTQILGSAARGGAPAEVLHPGAHAGGDRARSARRQPAAGSERPLGDAISCSPRTPPSASSASPARNIGNRLAIVLDKNVLSAPTIQAKISDNGVITGIGDA